MKHVAIIFARAPRLGTVKTRLAREVGARAALRFHQSMLTGLLRGLANEHRFRVVLALSPERARLRTPPRISRIPQGLGDLGQRMERAFRCFPRDRVVLVGCDIPDLGSADLVAAFRALGRSQAVFGPAEDGGYWLVGMGPRRPAHPFAGVRWSSSRALADTLVNFRRHPPARLRTLADVDSAADLHRLTAPRAAKTP